MLIDFIDDIFIEILSNFRLQSVQWFTKSLVDVPQQILNNGEKNSFIINLQSKDYEQNKRFYREFFDKYYKRCKLYVTKNY